MLCTLGTKDENVHRKERILIMLLTIQQVASLEVQPPVQGTQWIQACQARRHSVEEWAKLLDCQ